MLSKLQILQKLQMQKVVLTADLREQNAERAEYAANAANAAENLRLKSKTTVVLWRNCLHHRQCRADI